MHYYILSVFSPFSHVQYSTGLLDVNIKNIAEKQNSSSKPDGDWKSTPRLILHSDNKTNLTYYTCTTCLKEFSAKQSLSHAQNSYNYFACESCSKTLKQDWIFRKDFRSEKICSVLSRDLWSFKIMIAHTQWTGTEHQINVTLTTIKEKPSGNLEQLDS